MNLIIDFKKDFEDYIRTHLGADGFKNIPENSDLLFESYCNVIMRRIRPLKRKIIKSSEFQCPKKLFAGLKLFEDSVKRGSDLIHFQSKRILNTSYNDRMFTDWGIHHFHLGTDFQDNSIFIKRTSQLLYAIVSDVAIYCINVMNHGEWIVQELLTIVHDNWPDLISKYEINDQSALSLREDRKGNPGQQDENYFISIENKVYAAHKGNTVPGTGMKANVQADYLWQLLSGYENTVRENAVKYSQTIKKVTGLKLTQLHFKLEIDNTGRSYAREIQSQVRFKLGSI